MCLGATRGALACLACLHQWVLCAHEVWGDACSVVVYVLHCIHILSHLVVFIVPDTLMPTYFDVHKVHMCSCVYAAQRHSVDIVVFEPRFIMLFLFN